jgi:hypothetical protein
MAGRGRKEGFFFEKKNQKTFAYEWFIAPWGD